jgi:vacuolar protein sorting-associated protein 54
MAGDATPNGSSANGSSSSPADGKIPATPNNGNQKDNNSPAAVTPRDEAARVLEALPGGANYLDGFSLLQVIANPRGNPEDLLGSASVNVGASPSSFHGRYGATGSLSTADSTDFVTGTIAQFESTVVHVTGQMEALNAVLEGWSRQLLEEDPFGTSGNSGEEELPESQLRELPPALQSLSLHDLQAYLEGSGLLAHAFRDRQPMMERETAVEETPTPKILASLRQQIPPEFWEAESPVDLTDPDTFRQVFLAADPSNQQEEVDKTTSVFDISPLVPEESLNPWLDQIEMALMEAVREKSSDFFVESVRFGKLQSEIQALLAQVQKAQVDLTNVQEDVVRPSLALPQLNEERSECQALLLMVDQVQDLLQAKASIPGYLSAADDLTALEQVQYGRTRLLEQEGGDEGSEDAGEAKGRRRPLAHLGALHGVSKQLDQYQDLIVTNLREELVEVFMDWKVANGGYSSLITNHDRIQNIVRALHNCQGWEATWQAYRNRLHDVLRLTLRTIVGEFSSSTSSLTVPAFLECLDVTSEQFMTLLWAAVAVKDYCIEHKVFVGTQLVDQSKDQAEGTVEQEDGETDTLQRNVDEKASGVVVSSAELAAKSVSELLRMRKEAHSLVSLAEMKQIWDKCMAFSTQLEELTGAKATAMRSALLSQARAFAERQHEKHMSALAAALDSERWSQCQVSTERQEAISRLCSGRAILSRAFSNVDSADSGSTDDRKPDVLVGGVHYKVVWSCLLLVEMIMSDLSAAAHFSGLSTLMVTKVAELLRLFNARTTQLVLGAGAIHSAARLKSINAKHLSMVTQCLGMIISILPHVRAALMAHLPAKQHTLLSAVDQGKKELTEHNEKVLNKFVTIIGGIVEHGLAPKLAGTDFDVRAEQIPLGEDGSIPSCVFFEGVSSNTRKMHQVLVGLLPPDHLQDVFSRIFAFIDQQVPTIIIQASKSPPPKASANGGKSPQRQTSGPRSPQRQASGPRFTYPTSDAGKRRLLLEAEYMTKNLNGLDGVQPWDFSAVNVLEKRVEYSLHGDHAISGDTETEDEAKDEEEKSSEKDEGEGKDTGESQMPPQAADGVATREDVTTSEDPASPGVQEESAATASVKAPAVKAPSVEALEVPAASTDKQELVSEADTDATMDTTDPGDSEELQSSPDSRRNGDTEESGQVDESEEAKEEGQSTTAEVNNDSNKEAPEEMADESEKPDSSQYPAEVTTL